MADIKRMRYFDQQLLVLDDFTDEQAYHIAMRQRHNQLLHTPGIARGLEVNRTGVKEVKVKQGMAINEQGQEIVLDEESEAIKLDEFASGDKILITIRYKTVEDAPTGDPPQNRRILEKSELKKIKEGTGVPIDRSEVQLARITMGANDIVEPFDLTVRRVAGASAFANPEADFVVRSIAFSSAALPNTQWPRLSAGAANQVNVSSDLNARNLNLTGALSVTGALSALGNVGISGSLTVQSNLSIVGNLGVGTLAPQDKMHVSGGNLRLDNNRGLFIEDAAGAAKRVLHADTSNTLRIGGGGGLGFDRIDFDLGAANTVMTLSGGHAGIGTTAPENSEGWGRVLDLVGATTAKLSVRTNAIDARVMAHDIGWWGAPAGMVVGTKGNHSLSLATNAASRLTILGNGNIGVGNSAPDRNLTIDQPGPATGVFANIRNDNHEILFGVDQTAIVSAMTASDLQFRTNNAIRMVIKANTGNVGIGQADAQQKLHVAGNAIIGNAFLGDVGHGAVWAGFCHRDSVGATSYSLLQNNTGLFTLINKKSGGGYIGFRVDNGDKMVITDNGNVGIGTTNPIGTLDVRSNGIIKLGLEGNGGGQLILSNNTNDNKVFLEAFSVDGNGNASELLLTGRNSGPVPQITLVANSTVATGNLTVNGFAFKPGGGSWGNSSDLRLKKKIEPLTGALEKLLQLRGVCFEWVEPEKMGNQHGLQRGLIAQEVEPVFPEWISADTDGYKLLCIMGFEALMIEALRELKTEIESLKAQPVERAGARPPRSERKNK